MADDWYLEHFKHIETDLPPFLYDPDKSSWCYCGYRVNIRNLYVHTLYERWRRKQNIPAGMPWSDAERFEFEQAVIPHLEKKFKCKAPPPDVPLKVLCRLPLELSKRIYGVTGMDVVQDIKKEPPSAERKAV